MRRRDELPPTAVLNLLRRFSACPFRHGSPAPINSRSGANSTKSRPTGASQRPASPANALNSSNLSVTSVSSIGSGLPPTNPSGTRYSGNAGPSTPQPKYASSLIPSEVFHLLLLKARCLCLLLYFRQQTEKSRYTSPFVTTAERAPGSTPVRRGSNSSNNSVGSNMSNTLQSQDTANSRKKTTGISPMRTSLGQSPMMVTGTASQQQQRGSTPPVGLTSKRFTTATPQAATQYHDFDNSSQNSGSRAIPRGATPTKGGWKF